MPSSGVLPYEYQLARPGVTGKSGGRASANIGAAQSGENTASALQSRQKEIKIGKIFTVWMGGGGAQSEIPPLH